MNKRNLDNTAIDMIGRKLIERGALPLDDIDKIVANPRLFALVNKRIAENTKKSAGRLALTFFHGKFVAFAGVASMLIAVFAAASLLRPENTPLSAERPQVPDAVPEMARPVDPPQGTVVTTLATGRAFDREIRAEKPTAKTIFKKVKGKRRPPAADEPESDFYALSFPGNPGEMLDGGSVLRVEISKSSLFALGANIPLENGPDMLKADLLVGHDGVARGIRIVD